MFCYAPRLKRNWFLVLVFILCNHVLLAQISVTSSVKNIENNLPVTDVSVQVINTSNGVYTNRKGMFSFDNLDANAILKFSKIGFQSFTIAVRSIEKVVYLTPEISALDEVVLRSFSSSQIKKIVPDQVYLSQKDIEKMPFILGEKDVIKLIQYTPGVQQATEGQSGLLVRGGNASMNLTLLDNIYLHNTAHLGGLFSAINSDFVHSLEFSKAGFDASYGGRLASVTNIKTLKAPDSTSFNGSLGLLSSKLTGNIKLNKKNGLLLSGRRTYLEIFKPFFGDSNTILGNDKNYFLYDFFGKHTVILSNKGTLETTFYTTKDNFKDQTKGRNRNLKWGNTLFGSTYNHEFSRVLSSITTISNSYYSFLFSDNEFPFDYSAKSTFNVFGANHYFSWKKEKSLFKLGAEFNNTNILPKKVNALIDESPVSIQNQDTYNYKTFSVFSDLETQLSKKLEAKLGLRLSSFFTKENSLIDEHHFFGVEPRISVKYQSKKNQAYKLSYQRLNQFTHQASISSFSLPADFFIISTNKIKPQISNQYSFGYSYETNGLQLNSAAYYKRVINYTEFENGSVNNLFSNNIYDDVLVGQFKSYGLELSINKKVNKLTLQGALTLSKTIARFNEINEGKYFAATFDRPVNINSIAHYKLNNRIEFGALFIFTSGQNYTKPADIRVINERPIINFEAKNTSRFPNYHRLDVSCTYSFKKKGRWNSKLNLTLYNVYNNNNPFQISYSTNNDVNDAFIEIKEEKDGLFPFLPTVNWLFSF
ncbi:TonB-dependent receptor [Seonamhaeicola algicola]|uniref:TonB-dependent receptor n=1 Tax=Seonamhaeicola algicola TaxID=1719036 RepID=A0A5C7ARD7_9FLAO|nr:TonB-dependent receptor [Seonamhaeicola algicola]TXE10173.1 TonB-dependent receptor [Seonamhaeicola algicola]